MSEQRTVTGEPMPGSQIGSPAVVWKTAQEEMRGALSEGTKIRATIG